MNTNKLGILYIVGTPIGNLKDITFRAVEVLKEVEIIACEDTRRARILLEHYGIRGKLISYYGARERVKSENIRRAISEGRNVAVISDAGMPGISDPGSMIVRDATGMGARVVPIPGPSAIIAAVAASGFQSGRFVFEGFLPRKSHERKTRLLELSEDERTLVVFESPQRLRETLEDMHTVMGDREAVIAREITKIYEEFLRGNLSELLKKIGTERVRGEVVIVVGGNARKIDWETVDIPGYVQTVQERMGIDRKSALKLVAQLSGLRKNILYKQNIEQKKGPME